MSRVIGYADTLQCEHYYPKCGEKIEKDIENSKELQKAYDGFSFTAILQSQSEMDYPAHCAICHEPLGNDLTDEGRKYAREHGMEVEGDDEEVEEND